VLDDGSTRGRPKIVTDIDACETILMLAPETNGEVAVKAWRALQNRRARARSPRTAEGGRENPLPRSRRAAAQDHLLSDLVGHRSEKVCYNAGYTNVHELIPWRTLTGRQQLYQDHLWMRAFGEALCVYKPPVDLKTLHVKGDKPNGEIPRSLNFITPHQKWGIHSTYTDNLMMLTLNRGGPVVWVVGEGCAAGSHRRQRLDRGLQRERSSDGAGGRVPAYP
jgi:nitrate reductase alpha subunit